MPNKAAMYDFVVQFLKDKLPEEYSYHNPEHTIDVFEKALEIGRYERCTPEELDWLSAAALWHDTGYINKYKHHEEESCRLATVYLPEYGYSKAEIDTICNMIMATKIPQKPVNKLEEIIADADLEYLGTANYPVKSEQMYRELKTLDPDLTKEKWVEMQKTFLSNHQYFTGFCKRFREPVKQQQITKI